MSKFSNVFYSIACIVLCGTLLFLVLHDTPTDNSIQSFDDIITNPKDREVLRKLGIRQFVCTKDHKTNVIICKNER
jgi:hypothetical protein